MDTAEIGHEAKARRADFLGRRTLADDCFLFLHIRAEQSDRCDDLGIDLSGARLVERFGAGGAPSEPPTAGEWL
jgi:hypothetical protein